MLYKRERFPALTLHSGQKAELQGIRNSSRRRRRSLPTCQHRQGRKTIICGRRRQAAEQPCQLLTEGSFLRFFVKSVDINSGEVRSGAENRTTAISCHRSHHPGTRYHYPRTGFPPQINECFADNALTENGGADLRSAFSSQSPKPPFSGVRNSRSLPESLMILALPLRPPQNQLWLRTSTKSSQRGVGPFRRRTDHRSLLCLRGAGRSCKRTWRR